MKFDNRKLTGPGALFLLVLCLLSLATLLSVKGNHSYGVELLVSEQKANYLSGVYQTSSRVGVSSYRKWWPASTVKLWAAIGALKRVQAFGLSGSSRISMKAGWRGIYFCGSVRELVWNSLRHSDNLSFDLLVLIAGSDYLNTSARRWGLTHTWISRAYKLRSLRRSPVLWHGSRKLLSRRQSRLKSLSCPSNCSSLQDLQVLLYQSLANLHQLPRKDYRHLLHSLRRGSRHWLSPVLKNRCRSYKIWGKDGYVPGRDFVFNVSFTCNSRTFFVAGHTRARGNYKSRANRSIDRALRRYVLQSR